MCRSAIGTTFAALRAVFGVGRMLNAAILAANAADQAVFLTGRVANSGAGITFLTLRAIVREGKMRCSFDGLRTVETNSTVFLGRLMRAHGSHRAANVAIGVAEI